jgi:hypothetical protein
VSCAGQWILVSPHRAKRPWQGAQETPAKQTLPAHDPDRVITTMRMVNGVKYAHEGSLVWITLRMAGLPVPGNYHFAPRRDGDLPAYWADAAKADRELNWRVTRNLASRLRVTRQFSSRSALAASAQ